jgi:hypothetical protein
MSEMILVPSLKRRRELAQDAEEFHKVWVRAEAIIKAGGTVPKGFFTKELPPPKPLSEIDRAWVFEQSLITIKRIQNQQARARMCSSDAS